MYRYTQCEKMGEQMYSKWEQNISWPYCLSYNFCIAAPLHQQEHGQEAHPGPPGRVQGGDHQRSRGGNRGRGNDDPSVHCTFMTILYKNGLNGHFAKELFLYTLIISFLYCWQTKRNIVAVQVLYSVHITACLFYRSNLILINQSCWAGEALGR